MKFFLLLTSIYFSFLSPSHPEIAPKIAQSHTQQESLIDFRTSSGIFISIPTEEYLELIDGSISQLRTQNYVIRRRLGSRPVAYGDNNTKLFTLYLDVYNLQGNLLETKIHNQHKPV